MKTNYVIKGDCIQGMKTLPDNSIDSIVTDPPYELGFMGKSWDSTGIAFNIEVWKECLRVLKPGGHLIAFSGSRTYHRMAVAIEDAGFEIRDQIMWVYGSGFPKSHNISKGIDKATGAEREVIGFDASSKGIAPGANNYGGNSAEYENGHDITAPATAAAKQWQGWGTALKPAHEPMVLARKPVIGTVANNVLTYGVGGLNIDGSRVISDDWDEKTVLGKYRGTNEGNDSVTGNFGVKEIKSTNTDSTLIGRFPANFIHDGSDEVNDLLGEPARFFYCAKASKTDRNEGLDGFEAIQITGGGGLTADLREDGSLETASAGGKYGSIKAKKANHHPTVKPTTLMQYLIKLITPPGGIVLDPFLGSGSTAKAAVLSGFNWVGCELMEDYILIIKARVAWAKKEKKKQDKKSKQLRLL